PARKFLRRGAISLAGVALVITMVVLVQHLSLKPQPIHASIQPPQSPLLELPHEPSIAVVPFVNLSGDPGQEYLSDGIADDLTTDLSRIPGLFVIARSSSFAYKGRAITAQAVGRELGVKYILEGSVRKGNERLRINVQLVDATKGDQVW